jgi:hypothetical protein
MKRSKFVVVLAAWACASCTGPDPESEPDLEPRLSPLVQLELPRDTALSSVGLLARDTLYVADKNTVDDAHGRQSWIVSGVLGGKIGGDAMLGKESESVSVVARGDFDVGGDVSLVGGITASGVVTVDGTASVSGSVQSGVALPPPRVITLQQTFVVTGTNVALDSGVGPFQYALPPGDYDDVSAETGTELTLATGVYRLRNLKLNEGARLIVDDSAGPVIVLVEQSLLLDAYVDVKNAIENMGFVYFGASTVHVASPFTGTVVAPTATIELGGSETFEGGFFGREVLVVDQPQILQRPFAGWAALLAATASAPDPLLASALPSACPTPGSCCDASMQFVIGDAGKNAFATTSPDECVFADGGDDVITGFGTGGIAIGGYGDDFVSVGQGGRVHGGEGDDAIETLGSSIVFGNEGDDRITIPAGDNVVTPGPGLDVVELGPGADTIRITDACELEAGEVLDAGAGDDVLVSPLSLAQLAALGVVVEGVETVVIEHDACSSECRNVPDCNGAGVCVHDILGDALSCACDTAGAGADCSGDGIPAFSPSVAPDLSAVPPGSEDAAATAFVDWMALARVGDETAMRDELDQARSNPALRDAFGVLAEKLADSEVMHVAIPAIEAVAYLRCQACEETLATIAARPLQDDRRPVIDVHGPMITNQRHLETLAVARAAVGGLVFQGTESSRETLLDLVANHPNHDVRVLVIRSLLEAYGSDMLAPIQAVVLPTEQEELWHPL